MNPLYSSLIGTLGLLALLGCDTPRSATESNDPTLVASAASAGFRKDLTEGNHRFVVQTSGEGTDQLLLVRAEKSGRTIASSSQPLEGKVSDAVAANLNDDKFPEVFVFVTGGGSGSYGQVIGYEFMEAGRRLLTLPELTDKANLGYQGHDSFRIEGGQLLRSFPIYRPDDPNSTPSGGTRTVTYTLERGTNLKQAGFTDKP